MSIGQGIIVPLLTPFLENGDVDEAGLTCITERIAAAGLEGVFPLGTTGESARLSEDEKRQVLSAAAASKGDCLMYVGISGEGTKKVLAQMDAAMAFRPDAFVCTLPYYFQALTPQEQLHFFLEILDASPVPVLLYNMPGNVGCAILPETVAALAHHPSFGGMKDSSGDTRYFETLLSLGQAHGFPVLQGVEFQAAWSLRHGAAGLVPSMANLFPGVFAALRDAALHAEWEKLEDDQRLLDAVNSIHKKMQGKMAAIVCRKELLRMMGLAGNAVTQPHVSLPEPLRLELEAASEPLRLLEASLAR